MKHSCFERQALTLISRVLLSTCWRDFKQLLFREAYLRFSSKAEDFIFLFFVTSLLVWLQKEFKSYIMHFFLNRKNHATVSAMRGVCFFIFHYLLQSWKRCMLTLVMQPLCCSQNSSDFFCHTFPEQPVWMQTQCVLGLTQKR